MQDFRATLKDSTGNAVGQVDGTFDSGTPGRGTFETTESGELMQAALEGKPFELLVEGGQALSIRIESVETGQESGTSRVRFTTA